MPALSDRSRLALAHSISIFGGSMTWAGFPIFVANQTGNYSDAGILFATSTLAGFFFALAGGGLADRFSKKLLFSGSSIVSAAILGGFWAIDSYAYWSFLVLATITSIIDSFQTASVSSWYAEVCKRDGFDMEKSMAGRNASNLIAKVGGMAAGPILYDSIGPLALLIDGATSLLQVLILLGIPYSHQRSPQSSNKAGGLELLQSFRDSHLRKLLGASAATEIIRMTIAAGGIVHLKAIDSPGHLISGFWIFGLSGSLLASIALSRGALSRFSHSNRLVITFVLSGLGLLIFASANDNPLQLFIGLFVTCIGNVSFSVPLVARIASESKDTNRGRALGAQAAVDCGVGFVCVIYAGAFVHVGTAMFYPLLLPLILRTVLLRLSSMKTMEATAYD